MKKLLILAAITIGVFTLAPTNVEAGNYRSRVMGTCQHCHKSIYSYYRPVRYSSRSVRYSWVPSYHSNCSSRSRSSSYRRPTYYRPSYSSRNSYRSNRGFSGSRSGFSISFGGGRSCR